MGFDSSLPIEERIQKRRKQKRSRIIVVLLSVLVLSVYSYFFIGKSAENTTEESKKLQSSKNNENLKESQKIIDEKTNKIRTDIIKYISTFKGKYGVYFRNLNNEINFGVNESDEYIAANTIKIPLNLYLYEKMASGYVKYDGELTYKKEDYEEGTGEIRYQEFGKKYKIYELSRLSLVKSDNVADNILFRFLEKQKVMEYMKNSGGIKVGNDENISCPKDMALYMKLVFDFYKKNEKLGKELMGHFEASESKDRIPALLPRNLKVSNKTGNQAGTVNDVGIIFTGNPYVLSIMSKDVKEDEAKGVIANISKMVYDYVSSMQK